MNDLSWICDAPVTNVDKEVDLSLSKVDDCLKILAGLVIQNNFVGDCLRRWIKNHSELSMLFLYPLWRRLTIWRKIHNPNFDGENMTVLLFFIHSFEVTSGCWRKVCWFPFHRTKCLFSYSSSKLRWDRYPWFIMICWICSLSLLLMWGETTKKIFWSLDFLQCICFLNSGLPLQGWVYSGSPMR